MPQPFFVPPGTFSFTPCATSPPKLGSFEKRILPHQQTQMSQKKSCENWKVKPMFENIVLVVEAAQHVRSWHWFCHEARSRCFIVTPWTLTKPEFVRRHGSKPSNDNPLPSLLEQGLPSLRLAIWTLTAGPRNMVRQVKAGTGKRQVASSKLHGLPAKVGGKVKGVLLPWNKRALGTLSTLYTCTQG